MNNPQFVPDGILQTKKLPGELESRTTDAEYRVLESVAQRLGAERGKEYPRITGKLNNFSERASCESCIHVLAQFQAMFPNIQVQAVSGPLRFSTTGANTTERDFLYVEKAAAVYRKFFEGSTKGCTEEEVQVVEKSLGKQLPQAFREYLLWIGGGADLWVGSDWGYWMVEDRSLNESTREKLKETGFATPLPDDALIFWMHCGYQFRFIRLSEGEDPPVYYYHDAFVSDIPRDDFEKQATHFSTWLEESIGVYATWREELSRPVERLPVCSLARGREDRELQRTMEDPAYAAQLAAAVQGLKENLKRQGQGPLAQVIDQSIELAKQGVLEGLEAWIVTTVISSEEEVLKETLLLHKINQSRMT